MAAMKSKKSTKGNVDKNSQAHKKAPASKKVEEPVCEAFGHFNELPECMECGENFAEYQKSCLAKWSNKKETRKMKKEEREMKEEKKAKKVEEKKEVKNKKNNKNEEEKHDRRKEDKQEKKEVKNKKTEKKENEVDDFGFRLDSKNSKAMTLLFDKGYTMSDVKKKLGTTFYDALRKVEERGFKVIKKNDGTYKIK